jgi:HAE1 family hydrophobic/amphiphilic exporter-1
MIPLCAKTSRPSWTRVRKEIVPRFPTEWRITVLSVPPFNTGMSSANVQYFIAGPDLDTLTRATAE